MVYRLKAKAPAKLIISGEHSVVHGHPALAIAINKYAHTTTTWNKSSSMVSFRSLDFAMVNSCTMQTLKKLKVRLQEDYKNFLAGKCTIRQVLKRPMELLQFTVSNFLEELNISLPNGIEIEINSDIPMGCGMGSSAASVVSTIYGLLSLFNIKLDPLKLLDLSLEAENLQHGRSSGLDLSLATYGGCLYYKKGETQSRTISDFPLYIVNTGVPTATTGDCVSFVNSAFINTNIGNDFDIITTAIDKSMQDNKLANFKLAIAENNKLLQKIGVVPDKVAGFISEIETYGGAAKVCGAGSISGNNAGVVLVVGDDNYSDIAKKYDYEIELVVPDLQGARVV